MEEALQVKEDMVRWQKLLGAQESLLGGSCRHIMKRTNFCLLSKWLHARGLYSTNSRNIYNINFTTYDHNTGCSAILVAATALLIGLHHNCCPPSPPMKTVTWSNFHMFSQLNIGELAN